MGKLVPTHDLITAGRVAARRVIAAGAAALALGVFSTGAQAAGDLPEFPSRDWSWEGAFGTYDRAQLQRGFQVYREVCAGCHAVNYLYYRNLTEIGYTEDQVKAIASEVVVTDGPNDEGEMFDRPGRLSDRFAAPFPNDKAAASAMGGAVPKDLSMVVKARPDGANYVHALLTGYKDEVPADSEITLAPGQYYNEYFPGHVISMAPPLLEGIVEYAEGQPDPTLDQMAADVVAFMTWASHPELEERKKLGVRVILFLLVMTGILYAAKRKVWADVH